MKSRLQIFKFSFAIIILCMLLVFTFLTIYAYLMPSSKPIYDKLANSSCNYAQYALIGNMIINPLIIFALIPVSLAYYRGIGGNSPFMTVYIILFPIPIIWLLTISKHCSDLMDVNMLGQVILIQCIIGSFYIVGFFVFGVALVIYKLCYGDNFCSDKPGNELDVDTNLEETFV